MEVEASEEVGAVGAWGFEVVVVLQVLGHRWYVHIPTVVYIIHCDIPPRIRPMPAGRDDPDHIPVFVDLIEHTGDVEGGLATNAVGDEIEVRHVE
jgi:hypothetical protein